MSDEAVFHDLMRRVRAGEEEAAAELVKRFEPVIRRAARFRLRDNRLVGSVDVCQSVLVSFFVRAAAGQFEIDTPEELAKLLVRIARNKVASETRRDRAQRRDRRRVSSTGSMAGELVAAQSTPSEQISARELLAEVYRRLTPHELELVELRNQGEDWSSIALRLGVNAVVLRQRHSRALDRVSRELGLDEGHGSFGSHFSPIARGPSWLILWSRRYQIGQRGIADEPKLIGDLLMGITERPPRHPFRSRLCV